MKTQVLVIHGADAFETYEEYLSFLKTRSVSLDRFRSPYRDWKISLQDALGSQFDVLNPPMPNNKNARYSEWKIWFERIIPLLDEKVIFVGHSMGGIFLVKYLSENSYPKKVLGTYLVGTPFNTQKHHPLVDFVVEEKLEKFEKQAGKIFIYQSSDDPYVPASNAKRFKKVLPDAELRMYENKGHFIQADFPELVEDIKNLVGQ